MQTATKYFKTKFYEIKYFSLNLIYSNKRKNLFDIKRYTKNRYRRVSGTLCVEILNPWIVENQKSTEL